MTTPARSRAGGEHAMSGMDGRQQPGAPERRSTFGIRVRAWPAWARRAAGRHRWFLGVLGLGAALRVVAMLGYRPALWFPDSYTYVVTALRPRPDLVRPAGYSMFLRLLEPFHSFGGVVAVQHLLGLAMGVLVYAAVLRAGGRVWAAVPATVPVLLDAYQVQLEHLLVSDTLFAFLLVAAVFVLLGRRGPIVWRAAAGAGALLGAATLTRTIGLPLIAVVAAWLLLPRTASVKRRRASEDAHRADSPASSAAPGPGNVTLDPTPPSSGAEPSLPERGVTAGRTPRNRSPGMPTRGRIRAWLPGAPIRGRAGLAGVLVAAALVPIVGYGAWFWGTYQRFGIVGANGVFLYGRTMSFADCAVLRPPPDLAVLCDDRPPSRRPPSQWYVWAPDAPLVKLPGITFTQETDRLAGRFAFLALRGQPADYAASVLTELARSFSWGRPVYPDRETYDYYEFPTRAPAPPDGYPARHGAELAVRYERGAIDTRVVEPFAGWLRAYQGVARTPGTALLAVLLLPPALAAVRAVHGRRRNRAPGHAPTSDHAPAPGCAPASDHAPAPGCAPTSDRVSAADRVATPDRTSAPAEGSGADAAAGADGRWRGRGTGWALPWVVAVSLLVLPAATAEFDYRYVLPAVPLACLAAALLTAGRPGRSERPRPADPVNFQ
ncbi:hypothetical protein Sme01_24630 [Sphaerisporangium melleum]|uniref:Uncharacterized protein n=1 Tax=Sphaerisporangium melleum TaxID=321316 RepID=A0A917QSM8_9ACTN|nr:hypothetical protein [Sphaerisporangium melleum]GGK65204.1 hypothetical protein GCM10007964_05300 [Sphaerisporangium melleum]GII69987.1 hypothetical protein Sme01_24630 [Sphaerisporangium melleum]